jgi:membrane fusion protein, multidrug efflux system
LTPRALVGQLEATVKADEAMIEMAQTQLDYTKIRSPFAGRAGTRLIDIGNMVRATDAAGMVTINQMDPIFVTFALPAGSLPPILARSKIEEVKVSASDSNLAPLAEGRLSVIDNQISVATGTIIYKAVFENGARVLWPGQFVNVRLDLEIRRGVLAVPVTAVQQGADGSYVFVVLPNSRVEKRRVKVGLLTRTSAVIDEGVDVGERVVTDGQYRVQSGTLVEVLADVAPKG